MFSGGNILFKKRITRAIGWGGILFFLLLAQSELVIQNSPSVGAEDTQSPKLSKIKILDTEATSTKISWETDEEADSLVNFGLTKAVGIFRNPNIKELTHEVVLNDLEPSTKYYFRVVSTDSAGNTAASGNFSFFTKGLRTIEGLEGVATEEDKALVQKAVNAIAQIKDETALEIVSDQVKKTGEEVASPPRVIGIPSIEVGVSEVTITWETDKESNTVVALASEDNYDPSRSDPYTRREGNIDAYTTKHEVVLEGLRPGTVYHYQIISRSKLGLEAQSSDQTFRTKTVLPEIFSIRINKVEEESATISWSTQVPASAVVEYTNLSSRETKSVGNPSFLVGHTIRLINLKFRTRYSVVIRSRNEAGDETVANPITFITVKDEAPPVISQVNNESTLYPGADSKVQTIISWETDEPSYCQVFYSQGIAAPEDETLSFLKEANPTDKHVQVATEFAPSTVYRFWIECHDRNNNRTRSEDFVLFTPEKEKNIIDIILENFESTFGWVKNIGK